ncbi:substrate-binding domain-containing protein [Arthrobacter sp. TMN-49]
MWGGSRPAGQVRPSAKVVFNDRCALGVLDVLGKAGVSVPQDISVVGYDNSRLARLEHINLTSIGQNGPELATAAVHAATARLGGGAAEHLLVPPFLEIGGTTAAPASAS